MEFVHVFKINWGGGVKAHALSLGSAQRFIGKTNFVTS